MLFLDRGVGVLAAESELACKRSVILDQDSGIARFDGGTAGGAGVLGLR